MNHPTIQSKLEGLSTSIFTTVTQKAIQHKAINLGQGFPDFPMDPLLQDLVYKAMKDGFNQYAHTNGYPGLRQILADKMNSLYATSIHPETNVTITPGGTYAISNSLTSILRPGDEVIVFEPCFDSYFPNIRINGAVPVPVALSFPEYTIPWDIVRQKIGSKTRMILINSPHNPTGSLLRESDFEELRTLVEGTNILIMSDEVYEHLVFDGSRHLSILQYPDLFERSFVAFSLGKVFHCTGWKAGYTVAPDYLMKEFRNHHQFNVFSVQSAVQVAMAEYLRDPAVYLGLPAFFQQKRDRLQSAMKATLFEPLKSGGSYFQCYTYPDSVGMGSMELVNHLIEQVGVAAIPVSAFYQNGQDNKVLRFCFAKSDQTLAEAALRLQKFG